MEKKEFKYLFDRFFDPVRNYIYYRCGDEELATDIAQETFMKVWEKQMRIDIKEDIGLLYKMASNIFISQYRKRNVEQKYLASLSFQFGDDTAEEKLEYEELKKRYEKTLAKMPEKQRTVFLMSRIEELKYQEIAERLNISVKAVEKRMKHALAFLNAELKYK